MSKIFNFFKKYKFKNAFLILRIRLKNLFLNYLSKIFKFFPFPRNFFDLEIRYHYETSHFKIDEYKHINPYLKKLKCIKKYEIGIVVQGPVSSTTDELLTFLKKLDCKLVFSTWKNEPDKLSSNVKNNLNVIENEQPFDPGFLNINRQIVSTFYGLNFHKNSEFLVKIRSDELITNEFFLDHLSSLWEEFGTNKIINLNLPVYRPGHINDHFLAGPRELMLKMFNVNNLISEENYKKKYSNLILKNTFMRDWNSINSVENILSTNLFNIDFSGGLPEEFLRKCISSTIITDEFFLGLIQPKRSILDNSDYPYFLYNHNNFFDVTLKELDFRIIKKNLAKLRFDKINKNFRRLKFFDKLNHGNNFLL